MHHHGDVLRGCTEQVTAREERACGVMGSKTRFGSESLLENQTNLITVGTLIQPFDFLAGLLERGRGCLWSLVYCRAPQGSACFSFYIHSSLRLPLTLKVNENASRRPDSPSLLETQPSIRQEWLFWMAIFTHQLQSREVSVETANSRIWLETHHLLDF